MRIKHCDVVSQTIVTGIYDPCETLSDELLVDLMLRYPVEFIKGLGCNHHQLITFFEQSFEAVNRTEQLVLQDQSFEIPIDSRLPKMEASAIDPGWNKV